MANVGRIYEKAGLGGVIRRAARKALRAAGVRLLGAAERIEAPSIVESGYTPEERALLDRNLCFKNRHRGKRCFVIGNGPSLAGQDLTLLAGEITFVSNAFWNHPILDRWQPTYYCFADALHFDGSDVMREFFRNLNERVRDTDFFVLLTGAKVIAEQRLLPLDRTWYLSARGAPYDDRIGEIDLLEKLPAPRTVPQLAIMAAIYMGCTEIYLLGLDHDWLAHRGDDRHFYKGQAGMDKHAGVKTNLADESYRFMMESQLMVWDRYETLADHAAANGVRIVNLTDGGFLDVFPRGDYEEVVGGEGMGDRGIRE